MRGIVLASLAVFVAMAGLGVISPLMPYYAGALGASGIVLGLLFAAFPLARGIFSPYAGALSDREGRRWFVVAGLLAFAAISALYPFAAGVVPLFVVRFLHGAAAAVVITVAMASIAESADDDKEGEAMGVFHTAIYLGMATGPFIGGVISEAAGIPEAFYTMAALAAVAGIAAVAAVALPAGRPRPPAPGLTHPFLTIAADRPMAGILVFRAVHALGRGSILAFVPLFAHARGIGPEMVGLLLFVHILVIAVLQMPSGRLADRVPRPPLVLAGSLVSSVALLAVPFTDSFVPLLLACSATSLGTALSMPAAAVMAVDQGKKWGVGASLGVFNTAFSAGMIASPLISGLALDLFGTVGVFWTAGLIGLAGSAVFFLFSWGERETR